MADVVAPPIRSRIMSSIRGKDSQPEKLVRRLLFASGFRYRLHRRDLPGSPDIVLGRRRVVIFVHGCFWHRHEGCRYAKVPGSRTEFWTSKLERNVERDRTSVKVLRELGWRVLCVWECSTRDVGLHADLQRSLKNWIESDSTSFEISPKSLK
jgi:DNA mismatch endonuclease (patch repair protein)